MPAAVRAFGTLVRHWRTARRMSQLALAAGAEVSARHLCFLETGRAQPSRDMVHLLASALDVPLTDRNAMLLAAGYAPAYAERAHPHAMSVARVALARLGRYGVVQSLITLADAVA